ncbi:MAG: hypothetical protein ACKO0Z_08085 [Betaproteobacteria bacterium]
MSNKRIYTVFDSQSEETVMVEAISQEQAIRRVVADRYTAVVPTPMEVVELMRNNCTIITEPIKFEHAEDTANVA